MTPSTAISHRLEGSSASDARLQPIELTLYVAARAAAARFAADLNPPHAQAGAQLIVRYVPEPAGRGNITITLHLHRRRITLCDFPVASIRSHEDDRLHHVDLYDDRGRRVLAVSRNHAGRLVYAHTAAPEMLGLPGGTYDLPVLHGSSINAAEPIRRAQ